MVYFSVDGDFRYNPYLRMVVPTAVRKIEFHTAVGAWKVISYVHKVAEAPEAEHHALIKIEKGTRDIMSVDTIMKIRGRMFRNMIIENEIKGN